MAAVALAIICLITGRKLKSDVVVFGEVCPLTGALSSEGMSLTDARVDMLTNEGFTTIVVGASTPGSLSTGKKGFVKRVASLDDIVNTDYLLESQNETPTSGMEEPN